MSITLDAAQVVIEKARAQAVAMGVAMNIAVVDGGGHLVAFARMDGSILGSIDIALTKAKTSVLFNGPSENLWEFCRPGGPAPATEYTNGGKQPGPARCDPAPSPGVGHARHAGTADRRAVDRRAEQVAAQIC
ncbi:heme-binding protein [Streptomyces sp. NPDC001584]|uniref:GlcG/HbpS family heme-binding protein n=1 Tax=Streptomyces sp. NPDC001584 TaxID=3154521 RepID=UPI00332787B2